VRLLPYILYLILIAMHQVFMRDLTAIAGSRIDLAALIVLAVALYKSEVITLWFGLFAGIVMAAATPATMGWHGLFLALVGVTAFHLREKLNLESFYSKILFMFGGVVVHTIGTLIIERTDGVLVRIWTNALPDAVYTTIVALAFLLFKDGVITYRKFKSIF
jgi:rod shape-determining protein MreD